jgi:hypothetical protein
MGVVGTATKFTQYGGVRNDDFGRDDDGKDQVFCTMEAKLCPDGSYVGRTGPKCEFSACPPMGTIASSSPIASTTPGGPLLTGQIKGQVTLGPTCPVMRNPPDPGCADRAYQTTVTATVSGTQKEVGRQRTDMNGNFAFSFLPGTYDITAIGGETLPRCETKTVTIAKASVVTADISCDTGIR